MSTNHPENKTSIFIPQTILFFTPCAGEVISNFVKTRFLKNKTSKTLNL